MVRRLTIVGLLCILSALGLFYLLRQGPESLAPAHERMESATAPIQPSEAALSKSASASALEAPLVPGRHELQPAASQAKLPSPSAAGESRQSSLRGRVVDDLGQPVASFGIESRRQFGDEDPFGLLAWAGRRHFDSPDGIFELDRLGPGEWVLLAYGNGDSRSAPVTWLLPNVGDGPVLVLSRGAVIAGVVRSPAGTPVSDAGIFLQYPGTHQQTFSRRESETLSTLGYAGPEPRCTSDAEGRFRIEQVQPGSFQLMATHADHCDSEWLSVSVPPSAEAEVEIQLAQGGRVVGTVDPSLGTVSNRQVSLYSFRGTIGWREARTDSLGSFSIENVIPQDYIVELPAAEYPPSFIDVAVGGFRKRISVRKGETTEVLFSESGRRISISGTITSIGTPVAGIGVRATPRGGGADTLDETTSGVDGRYELPVNGPGEYRFVLTSTIGSYAFFDRTVPDSEATEIHFEVPGGALSGRILTPDGEPVSWAPVTVLRQGGAAQMDVATLMNRYRSSKTDKNGNFAFGMLTAGTYTIRTLDGSQQELPPTRFPYGQAILRDIEVQHAPVEGLDIRLHAEGRIAGRVVDSGGSPFANAKIQIYDASGLGLSVIWETKTDVTGYFIVHSVAPGSHAVEARVGERQARSPFVQVRAGETADTEIVIL